MKKLLLIFALCLINWSVVADIPTKIVRDTLKISHYSEIKGDNNDFTLQLNESVREKDSVESEFYKYLPVYEFANNDAGIFVSNVSDSIAKYDPYGSRTLQIFKYGDEPFPEFALLSSCLMTRDRIDRVKGIVINEYKNKNNKIVRSELYLYSDNPDWLKAFGLRKSYKKIRVILNKTTNMVWAFADSVYFTVCFSASSSGMVEIRALHISRTPAHEYITRLKDRFSNELTKENDILNLNRWIRQFYQSHDYPVTLPYWPEE